MNATLINGGKVHRLSDGIAKCGVGRTTNKRAWQMELGDVTCLRCVKVEKNTVATETQRHREQIRLMNRETRETREPGF